MLVKEEDQEHLQLMKLANARQNVNVNQIASLYACHLQQKLMSTYDQGVNDTDNCPWDNVYGTFVV